MHRTGVARAGMAMCPIEQDDFDWIVSENQKRIFRTLLLLVRDADAAENLTQECFMRAFRMRNRFRGESEVATWLMRIAINLAHDHNRNKRWAFWRRLTRTESIDAIAPVDARRTPEEALIESESLGSVWSAVGRLPERQKTVFSLHYFDEMSLEEISETMNLELGTIKSHLHRAIARVRKTCGSRTPISGVGK
jgi:RNA polymerase sigma-70 factor, ECF subfamily